MICIRKAQDEEAAALTALCLRSKAHWGYDAAFMAACREELTIRPQDVLDGVFAVAEEAPGDLLGVAQIAAAGDPCDLMLLYVEPAAMGRGVGRALFDWAVGEARRRGIRRMRIEADPHAEAFYRRMGAVRVGEAPSGSIAGRFLPLLELALDAGP
ncbi:MAG: GNAT family N-acetyltransferase [Alphaproteobacteria bacterium]|nr:GNAT family N-acetyltransferase [Alphaproteobacteria bacterium]